MWRQRHCCSAMCTEFAVGIGKKPQRTVAAEIRMAISHSALDMRKSSRSGARGILNWHKAHQRQHGMATLTTQQPHNKLQPHQQRRKAWQNRHLASPSPSLEDSPTPMGQLLPMFTTNFGICQCRLWQRQNQADINAKMKVGKHPPLHAPTSKTLSLSNVNPNHYCGIRGRRYDNSG